MIVRPNEIQLQIVNNTDIDLVYTSKTTIHGLMLEIRRRDQVRPDGGVIAPRDSLPQEFGAIRYEDRTK